MADETKKKPAAPKKEKEAKPAAEKARQRKRLRPKKPRETGGGKVRQKGRARG